MGVAIKTIGCTGALGAAFFLVAMIFLK